MRELWDAMNIKKKFTTGIILILLLFSIPGSYNSLAASSANKVDTQFNIEFKNATDLEINVNADIEKITLSASGKTYTSEEIKETSTDNPEKMGAIKYAVKTLLTDQIKQTFQGAEIVSVNELPIYENELFKDEYIVNLTSNFFDINKTINAHQLINGILDMGGRANYTFYLTAEEGWKNIYEFREPSSLKWRAANVEMAADKVAWTVDNKEGDTSEEEATLTIEASNPTTSKIKNEDISLNFEIDSRNPQKNELITKILTRNVSIKEYNNLPSFISNIEFITADGIRLFVNNILTWDKFYNRTIKEIEKNIISKIENSSFNKTLDTIFYWEQNTTSINKDAYDIQNMDSDPPVTAILKDNNLEIKAFNLSLRTLYGLIKSGGKVNLSLNDLDLSPGLKKVEYPYNVTLQLPEGFALDGKNIFVWNKEKNISSNLNAKNPKEYSQEEISSTITVNFKNVELNMFNFIKGKTECNFEVLSSEEKEYKVTKIPNEFKNKIPEEIEVSYLNSDCFRLCVEEKVFTKEDLSSFLNDKKQIFESIVSDILKREGITGKTDEEAFENSLNQWNGNIKEMDKENPVVVKSYAASTYPASIDLSFLPPDMKIKSQNFTFQGVEKQNVTYQIFFPKGLSVSIVNSSNRADIKEANDGRKYIEVKFNESEGKLQETIKCKFIPSILFILGLFTPCIVAIVIAIILMIIIYIIKKKRGGKQHTPHRREKDESYREKEYYIPPPPPSSRE